MRVAAAALSPGSSLPSPTKAPPSLAFEGHDGVAAARDPNSAAAAFSSAPLRAVPERGVSPKERYTPACMRLAPTFLRLTPLLVFAAVACTAPVEGGARPPSSAAHTHEQSQSSRPAAGSPEAVVQAQLEAYNRGDLDNFMATFHPEAELFALGDPAPRAQGREAVRGIYRELFARSPELHSDLVHRAVFGDRVIDHERITGREGGDVLELIMVYEVEDGGIRRAWSIK